MGSSFSRGVCVAAVVKQSRRSVRWAAAAVRRQPPACTGGCLSRSWRKASPKRGPAAATTGTTSKNTSKALMRAIHTWALSETERAQHARAFRCSLLHNCSANQIGFTQRSCVCTVCHPCLGCYQTNRRVPVSRRVRCPRVCLRCIKA